MKIVKKNNRVLRIADDRLERYLQAGYCEIDKTGKVLTAAKRGGAVPRKYRVALRRT